MDKTTQTSNLDISNCNIASTGKVAKEGKVVTDVSANSNSVTAADPISFVLKNDTPTTKPDETTPPTCVRSTDIPDATASAAVVLTELKTDSMSESVESTTVSPVANVHTPSPVKKEETVTDPVDSKDCSTPCQKIKTKNVNDVSPDSVPGAAATTPSKVKAKVCIMSDRKFVLKLLTHTHHEFFISLRRRNIPSLTKHLPVSPRPNRQKCLVARSAPWNLMNLILSLIGPLWSILLQGPSGNSK